MNTTGGQGQAPAPVAAAWYPDALHRHELRYWDGHTWTEHVADHGRASSDPITAIAPADSIEHSAVASQSPQPRGSAGRINPEAPIVGVQKTGQGTDSVAVQVRQRRWQDVPDRLRAVFEAAMAPGEIPCVCSWAGLLLTDRSLVVAEKFPGGIRSKKAERFELADISDVDENGFTCRGVRQKLKWKKGDETAVSDGFLWLFLRLHPECAPRIILQDSERQDRAAPHATVQVGHLVTGHSSSITAGSTLIQTQYATSPVQAILRPPDSRSVDYYQFVDCPVCGAALRLRAHGEDFSLCNPGKSVSVPGGTYAVVAAQHKVSRPDSTS